MRKLAAALAVASMACGCGAQQSGSAPRRVIVVAPASIETNMTGPDGTVLDQNHAPTTAPCVEVCAPVQASDERLASCQIASTSPSISQRFPNDSFLICKLVRR